MESKYRLKVSAIPEEHHRNSMLESVDNDESKLLRSYNDVEIKVTVDDDDPTLTRNMSSTSMYKKTPLKLNYPKVPALTLSEINKGVIDTIKKASNSSRFSDISPLKPVAPTDLPTDLNCYKIDRIFVSKLKKGKKPRKVHKKAK